MTDKDSLFLFRLKQAEETLLDAEKMLKGDITPRSITNRAYYSMFYALLALFIKTDVNIKTSKHSGREWRASTKYPARFLKSEMTPV